MSVIRRPLLSPHLQSGKLVERMQITHIELPPGEPTGLHVHPVPVVGYILTGRIQFQIDGQAPLSLDAGDAFYEPAGLRILHFDNLSRAEPATFVAVYLLGANDRS